MRNLEMYESYLNRIHNEVSSKLMKSVVEVTNLLFLRPCLVVRKKRTKISLSSSARQTS